MNIFGTYKQFLRLIKEKNLHLTKTVDVQKYMFMLVDSPVGWRPVFINITDCLYKSALRFLKCSTEPNNTHGIALLDPLDFYLDQLAERKTIR